MRPANIIKNHMSHYVPLEERVALQCAGMEASRLLCHMASKEAGYHVEEIVHVLDLWGLTPVGAWAADGQPMGSRDTTVLAATTTRIPQE